MKNIEIKSEHTSASLTFYNWDGEYLDVKYESPSTKLTRRVWILYEYDSLVELFQSIAKEQRGWDGAKSWHSTDDEFGITATRDSLGHIALILAINNPNEKEALEATVMFYINSYQAESLAKQVDHYFAT